MLRQSICFLLLSTIGLNSTTVSAQQTTTKTLHKKPGTSQKEETIVINDPAGSSVEVELKGGNLYINGELQSEIKDLKNEDHKVIINLRKANDAPTAKKEIIIKEMQSTSRKPLLGVYTAATDNGGVLITDIMPGSAAEMAGLHAGDVIHQVDGHTVNTPADLSRVIGSYGIGDDVVLSIDRGSDHNRIKATLMAANNDNSDVDEVIDPITGKSLLNIPFGNGKGLMLYDHEPVRMGITAKDAANNKGVEVLAVKERSAAEKAGIQVGDIITKVDHDRVYTVGDIQATLQVADTLHRVKVDLRRNGEPISIDLDLSGADHQKDL